VALVRCTGDDSERVTFEECRESERDVEKTFLPVVQPHQYSPAGAAAAAVVSERHLQHVQVPTLAQKQLEGTCYSAYLQWRYAL